MLIYHEITPAGGGGYFSYNNQSQTTITGPNSVSLAK